MFGGFGAMSLTIKLGFWVHVGTKNMLNPEEFDS